MKYEPSAKLSLFLKNKKPMIHRVAPLIFSFVLFKLKSKLLDSLFKIMRRAVWVPGLGVWWLFQTGSHQPVRPYTSVLHTLAFTRFRSMWLRAQLAEWLTLAKELISRAHGTRMSVRQFSAGAGFIWDEVHTLLVKVRKFLSILVSTSNRAKIKKKLELKTTEAEMKGIIYGVGTLTLIFALNRVHCAPMKQTRQTVRLLRSVIRLSFFQPW